MLKRAKKTVVGILVVMMLLGSSLTVFAGVCPAGGNHDMYISKRVFHHRDKLSDHVHLYVTDDGYLNFYQCTSYQYYYTETQTCSKCKSTMTLSEPRAYGDPVHVRK